MPKFKEQLSVRGLIIGLLGCVIITSSSVYVALKMGALPWPIFFVVLLALFSLKAIGRIPGARKSNINEANVSASIMGAGAMVAGGLAFTVPGIWIALGDIHLPWWKLLVCAISGVGLGVIATALFRKHFVVDSKLPFPIGRGAAETLKAGDEGGEKAGLLFGSLGISGIFTFLRDGLPMFFSKLTVIPAMLFSKVQIPGVSFGIYASPMALAMGFMIAPIVALVWIVGGLFGNFGIMVAGTHWLGLSLETAGAIRSSLGIGLMIGCGVGIVLKEVLPRAKSLLAPLISPSKGESIVPMRWAPFLLLVIVVILSFIAGLGLPASLLLILLVWLVMTMAAQSTGQAGLNPMEVFGIIVMMVITLIVHIGGLEAFLVAATITVACGFVGDLMNDFKVGSLLKTDPRAQWIGVGVGGVVGAIVGTSIILLFLAAYGPGSFGSGQLFVAPQASIVAAMVTGIPHLPAFLIGLAVGAVAYLLKAPVITLGLGVYLPFYLTLTIAVGALVAFIVRRIAPQWSKKEDGVIIASGLLGGESIVGVILALVALGTGVLVR